MLVKEFDYSLPPELIAQHPLPRREDSRMMVVRRESGEIDHSEFRRFPDYVSRADVVVLNDTRVIPAKAWGMKAGVSIEFLFIKEIEPGFWEVLCRPAKKTAPGDRIYFSQGFEAEVVGRGERGKRTLRFNRGEVLHLLDEAGFAPLPPYIKRGLNRAAARAQDLERYQTVFARKSGAIAAPTAGMHFTEETLAGMKRKGATVVAVTLEVGLATFQPIRVDRVEEHQMLEERFEIPLGTSRAVNAAKRQGKPVIAVGTTVVRALESAYHQKNPPKSPHVNEKDADKVSEPEARYSARSDSSSGVRPGAGITSLFIRPGYEFKAVDRMLTNFHLPRSTLLMLVSAFAGRDLILRAYREAVRERYRFFSYGDCMLIL